MPNIHMRLFHFPQSSLALSFIIFGIVDNSLNSPFQTWKWGHHIYITSLCDDCMKSRVIFLMPHLVHSQHQERAPFSHTLATQHMVQNEQHPDTWTLVINTEAQAPLLIRTYLIRICICT